MAPQPDRHEAAIRTRNSPQAPGTLRIDRPRANPRPVAGCRRRSRAGTRWDHLPTSHANGDALPSR